MNLRERFNRIMHFQEVDRAPNFEVGFWGEALERWHQEGLPRSVRNVYVGPCVPFHITEEIKKLSPKELDDTVERALFGEVWREHFIEDVLFPKPGEVGLTDYFGFDRHMRTCFGPDVSYPIHAALPRPSPPKIIRDEGDNVVVVDGFGTMYREQKMMKSIPQYIKFAVETMKDWESIKARLDPSNPGRYPKNWDKLVRALKKRDYPLCIMYGGFWWTPRDLMGTPNLCKALYTNPELVLDINEHWCHFIIEVTRKALEEVDYDCAWILEDMAYKGRAMMSPTHFRKFILLHYKRLTKFLRQYGVDVIIVDSDGYMHGLVPLLIEGGITGVWPLEVAAGNDLATLRREYPKRFILMGGIDKYALALGSDAIDKELSKITPLLEDGGYIPTVDHMIQPNVSLENMTYYAKTKKKLILEAEKNEVFSFQ